MEKTPNHEEKAQSLLAAGGQVRPSQVPILTCSGFRLSISTNECVIQLQRQRPVVLVSGNEQIEGIQQEAVAVLSMSVQSLKDLAILATEQVSLFEREWGVIETEFSRSRAKAKK